MSEENLSQPAPLKESKIKRFFRLIKRIIITLSVLLFLLIATVISLGFYYQDEVKNYIIGELNKNLNTQVIIDGKDINFTVLKNFPFASLDFNNIKVLDAIESEKKDTLLKAKNISLQFNIIDIFKKNYRIKKLVFDDAQLGIRIDKKGNDNYHFWKSSPNSDTANFSFALEEIILKQLQVNYSDKKQLIQINSLLHKAKLSGEFSKQNYSLDIVSDMFIRELKSGETNYVRNKNVTLETTLEVDNQKNTFKLRDSKLAIEQLHFMALGNVIIGNETNLDINIEGKDMDIRSVLSLIPVKYKEKINDYASDGQFYFNMHIKGKIDNGSMPHITANFGIRNSEISQAKSDIVLKSVNLKGYFSNGKKHTLQSSDLIIESFSALFGQGKLSGSLSIHDFENLIIDSKLQADISLEGLQEFIKFDTVETLSGNMKLDVNVTGKWDDIYSINKENNTTTGSLVLSEMNIKLKNNILLFKNINGNFSFDDNNLVINQFRGNVSNSDFDLNGKLKNIVGYFFKEKETLVVEASLLSNSIDLNELLQDKDESKASEGEYKLRFTDNIDFNLNSSIGQLVFRKFEAREIKGIMILKDRKLLLEPIVFSTMDGRVGASGVIDGRDTTKLLVSFYTELKDINVTKLFTSFENFGQTYVTNTNIKGVASANIEFKAPMSPDLVINEDELIANADMIIEKGELNNVESMKSLSRYIALEELMNVKFSTLKNNIEIKKQTIYFPKMEIRSNAINLSASGTHTFNNEINYKIKLTLDEILSKKAKRNKKENDEFGEVADDGTGRTNIFISMTGTVDNPIIKYDTKEAMQSLKQNVKEEKQTLKSILHKEFGWFKKDSTLGKQEKKEESPAFKINWEEQESAPKEEQKKTLKPPKKKEQEEDF